MSEMPTTIEKRIRLSAEREDRLTHRSHARWISEDQIVEKALDILFSLTDLFDERAEQRGWSFLSEDALQRVWDNDEDATYDSGRELKEMKRLAQVANQAQRSVK